jgi:hypothetical protein
MRSPTSPTSRQRPTATAAFTRPVAVEVPRLAWLQLLGWLSADRYEPGTLPWLDELVDEIEKRVH